MSKLFDSPAAHSNATAPLALDHVGAMLALRDAQVQLYCDHDAAAISALAEARRSLMAEAVPEATALATLEAAAWHIRRHETDAAQRAIVQVRDRLAMA